MVKATFPILTYKFILTLVFNKVFGGDIFNSEVTFFIPPNSTYGDNIISPRTNGEEFLSIGSRAFGEPKEEIKFIIFFKIPSSILFDDVYNDDS